MKKTIVSFVLYFTSFTILCNPVAYADTGYGNPDNGPVIETLNIKKLSMLQFARLLSQGCGWKIVVSEGASNITISTYLENVHVEDAVEAVCQAYNLWYKKDAKSDIISIVTLDEYQKGMRIHKDEHIEVVTLKYPDARSIGDALHLLFVDRVVWSRIKTQDDDSIRDIEEALERMDMLADRTEFLEDDSESNNRSSYSSNRYSDRYSNRYSNRRTSPYSSYGSGNYAQTNQNYLFDHIDTEQEADPRSLLEVLSQSDGQIFKERIDQPGVVYISVFEGSNDLILRSNDPESIQEVMDVIHKLDKPQPQVLLEIKVLDILHDKENSRGVDWLFSGGDISGGRSTGIDSEGFGGSYGRIGAPSANLIPQGSGLEPRAAVLQVVTDDVMARLQWLEDNNRVIRLATPTLCVADNEASRIFVGTETTILESVSIQQDTTSGDNPVTTVSTDPETERINIGTTLLITPRIHADRTATIRIVQEESSLGSIQTISFGEDSFRSQDVETSSVVTTIITSDGQISAIGGLIQEVNSERKSGIPGLMNLPLVGNLFKTTLKNKELHEILVLIRPSILLAPGEVESASNELFQRLNEHPVSSYDMSSDPIKRKNVERNNHKEGYQVPNEVIEEILKKLKTEP